MKLPAALAAIAFLIFAVLLRVYCTRSQPGSPIRPLQPPTTPPPSYSHLSEATPSSADSLADSPRRVTAPPTPLHLTRSGTLNGRVCDQSGRPLQGAFVYRISPSDFTLTTTDGPDCTTTDSAGHWTFTVTHSGLIDVGVLYASYAPLLVPDVYASGTEHLTYQDITLPAAASISGTLRYTDGQPAQHISITAFLAALPEHRNPPHYLALPPGRMLVRRYPVSDVSDENGCYTIGGLLPDQAYRLTIAGGCASVVGDFSSPREPIIPPSRDIDFMLIQTVRLSVTPVADATGVAVDAFDVLYRLEADPDWRFLPRMPGTRSGTFTLDLPPACYRIMVSAPGYDSWQDVVTLRAAQPVALVAPRLHAELDAPGSITVIATDELRQLLPPPRLWAKRIGSFTPFKGRGVLSRVPPGFYSIRSGVPGAYLPITTSIDVAPGARVTLPLTFTRAGRLTLHVVDPAGEYVFNASAQLLNERGDEVRAGFGSFDVSGTEAVSAGVVVSEPLAPGHYKLAITCPGFVAETRTVEVTAGVNSNVAVTLTPRR